MFSHVFIGVSDFDRALTKYPPWVAAPVLRRTTMRRTTAPMRATRTETR